jgi:hypothetical protein
VEVENRTLGESEEAQVEEMVDMEDSEAGKIGVDVGRVKWSVFAFSATAKCRTRVVFVLVLEVAAKTEPDFSVATAATESVVDL